MKKYDAIIIGFGKGGKTLASKLSSLSLKVAMIEKDEKMYGGTCINEGCIPSKSLITQAGHLEYQEAIKQKEKLITTLREKNYQKLNQDRNVDVYLGEASFIDEHRVSINNEDELYGNYIFINTGAYSFIPPIKGINETKHIYTSASLMKEEILPKRLGIIGGGYIGLEFASMYARYGSDVTVFETNDRLISREDEDVASTIQQILEDQGVTFIFNSRIDSFENKDEEVIVNNNNESYIFDGVLLATGRRPNTTSLNLEKANVKTNERGEIIVNEYLETTQENIFALGDVKGGLQFTYISLDDYRIVYDYLFECGTRNTNNRGHVPYSVFISPTFSRIGMSEKEARDQGYDIVVTKMYTNAIPKAHVLKKPEGMLKAIINKDNDEILGCVLIMEHSQEVINLLTLVMNQHLPYTVLKNQIFSHPTMSESLNDLFNL